MAKRLEYKNTSVKDDNGKNVNYLIELMRLLLNAQVNKDETELNKVSFKDVLGRRILY